MLPLHKNTAKLSTRQMRQDFRKALVSSLRVVWPILSGLLICILGLGLLIGWREDWSIGDSLYFAFITGLTIGYGDLVPHFPLTKIMAVMIGLFGMLMTAVIAAQAVYALQKTAQKNKGEARGEKD